MERHVRDNYYVVSEGQLSAGTQGGGCEQLSTAAALRAFRFSRLGPKSGPIDVNLLDKVARAMTVASADDGATRPVPANPPVPAGFTYLGQFVGHDLTTDNTGRALDENVKVNELLQGRSPALDLDSVYGRGPKDADDNRLYAPGGIKLKVGITAAVDGAGTNINLNGYDLPRTTHGSTKAERQSALIANPRNDQNLILAQTHLAFLHFHNRVVDELADQGVPRSLLFEQAREVVVRHYQWMVRTDLLPRIVDRSIVDDVFDNGRRFFEVAANGNTPTMPIEFAVAAYRFGHSMIRASYNWNRIFSGTTGTLRQMFVFSGLGGNFDPFAADLNDQESGLFERLPTNWAVDWRQMFDFATETGRNDLAALGGINLAQRIDTLLVDPLSTLPNGAFGGLGNLPAIERNQAFRDLLRANTVELATGQDMAELFGLPALEPDEIITGSGGAELDRLSPQERTAFASRTPLWFYILREAELNGGRLTGVGGRLVAEVFHRAIEGSRISIARNPAWHPTLGPDPDTFRMVDLLLFAFQGRKDLLAPLGDTAP
jgi:hypothetical protein